MKKKRKIKTDIPIEDFNSYDKETLENEGMLTPEMEEKLFAEEAMLNGADYLPLPGLDEEPEIPWDEEE